MIKIQQTLLLLFLNAGIVFNSNAINNLNHENFTGNEDIHIDFGISGKFLTSFYLQPACDWIIDYVPLDMAKESRVKNPYAGVNWSTVKHYKANFHCHTIYSDGRAEPDKLIYNYANAGYDILAITDHDSYHVTREGETHIDPTPETTWPWTNWISHEPSRISEYDGMETSAFFPNLGTRGMLAIRGNELTTDPHIVSLFNDFGFWERGEQTDPARLTCIEEKGGLSYYAHPTDYVPGGRWEDQIGGACWDQAVEYFGDYITRYDSNIGFEMQLGRRQERDEELLNRLLQEHLQDYDLFIMGGDDSHSKEVSDNATITIVLAEELTEEAVRYALENGHSFVGSRVDILPEFNKISVDEDSKIISLDIKNYDKIIWIKNGEYYKEGNSVNYTEFNETVLRFQVEVNGSTFYSQAFYIY